MRAQCNAQLRRHSRRLIHQDCLHDNDGAGATALAAEKPLAGRAAGAEAEGNGARVSRRPFPLTPNRLAPNGMVVRSPLVHWTPARLPQGS